MPIKIKEVKNYVFKICAFCLLLLSGLKGYSQGIPNDICETADYLFSFQDTTCFSMRYQFAGAQTEGSASSCGADSSNAAYDQWFFFTASDTSQIIDVTTYADSVGAVVELYDACGGNKIACEYPTVINLGLFNVALPGTTHIQADSLVTGNLYFIRIYNYGDSLPNNPEAYFDICVHGINPTPVSNDLCDGAQALFVGNNQCFGAVGDINNSNEEFPANACGSVAASPNSSDLWYHFVATDTAQVIEVAPFVSGNNAIAPVVEIYEDCGSPLYACVAAPGISQPVTVYLYACEIGKDYRIRVYHYGLTQPQDGLFTICVRTLPAVPTNDLCDMSEVLTANDTCISTMGSVARASQEIDPENCQGTESPTANDVWYYFNATDAAQTISVTSTQINPAIALYDNCGGTLLACANDALTSGTATINATGLMGGSYYFVRVYDNGYGVIDKGEFSICVYNTIQRPKNDVCAGSTSIEAAANDSCSNTSATLAGSSQEANPGTCDSIPSPSAYDVWFRFQANDTTHTVSVNSLGFGAVVEVYDMLDGHCNVQLNCAQPVIVPTAIDTLTLPGITTLKLDELMPNSEYFVRVYAWGDSVPQQPDFTICVYTDTLDLSSGINRYQGNQTLTLYPNPATEDIQVSFVAASTYRLNLIDLTGKKVYQVAGKATGTATEKISLATLPKGMYLVEVITDKEVVTKKLIKK